MDHELTILDRNRESTVATFELPKNVTFTRSISSAASNEYFARVTESRNHPEVLLTTVVTVPARPEPQTGVSAEDQAYQHMGRDPEVIAESRSDRVRLSRRGRDTLED